MLNAQAGETGTPKKSAEINIAAAPVTRTLLLNLRPSNAALLRYN
jgi:hypothetical protein